MTAKNNFVFTLLTILTWIIFIGLSIEAGSLIFILVLKLLRPEFVSPVYNQMDLSQLFNSSRAVFYALYSFVIAIALMKAHLFYAVIRLLSKLDLTKPFTPYVAKQIGQISYFTLSIGLVSYIARQSAKNLLHRGYPVEQLNQFWVDSQAYILMAAIIYIIATIFKKGIELQNENDLTV